MRPVFVLVVAFVLSGCGTIEAIVAPPYVPDPIHIYDPVMYAIDVAECAKAGAEFVPAFSFGSAATKVLDGATANSSMIPISPWVPVAGAAGGALSAAGDATGVMSGEHANVFKNCLHDETQIDGSAVLINPN